MPLAASKLESSASPIFLHDLQHVLPDGRALWGVLDRVEPVGGGLLRIVVSGRERLVDECLLEKLQALVGRQVAIGHLFGQWGAGEMPVTSWRRS